MKHPFSVYQKQVDDHVFWVAESATLKGCVAQGDTMQEALSLFEEVEADWLDTAEELGMPIPTPVIVQPQEYSGKFLVRTSPSVHKQAAVSAKQENISLNQYVNDAIVEKNCCTQFRAIIDEAKSAIQSETTKPRKSEEIRRFPYDLHYISKFEFVN